MKPYAALGEAGAIVYDNAALLPVFRTRTYHNLVGKEFCAEAGANYRMDALQAAFLVERLTTLDTVIRRRRDIAARYLREIGHIVELQQEPDGFVSARYTCVAIVDDRDALGAYLSERGIETKIHYSLLMPQQAAYRDARGAWPKGERVVSKLISLPASQALTDDQQSLVVSAVRDFYGDSS